MLYLSFAKKIKPRRTSVDTESVGCSIGCVGVKWRVYWGPGGGWSKPSTTARLSLSVVVDEAADEAEAGDAPRIVRHKSVCAELCV